MKVSEITEKTLDDNTKLYSMVVSSPSLSNMKMVRKMLE